MTDETYKIRLHRRCGDDESVEALEQVLTENGYGIDVVDDARPKRLRTSIRIATGS